MKKFGRAGSTFGTVVAGALVLGLATTGGAVAGSLVTSKQIKNNTIQSIDVRDGSLKGIDVANGSLTGADVADGSLSATDLAAGTLSGALTSPLPSGKTVRGTIGEQANNLIAGDEIGASASLPMPATVALDDAHIAVDGSDEPTGACPGTATNPTAAPGYVCIYPYSTNNVQSSPTGHVWGSDAAANEKYGFQVSFSASANGTSWLFANWAYTAP